MKIRILLLTLVLAMCSVAFLTGEAVAQSYPVYGSVLKDGAAYQNVIVTVTNLRTAEYLTDTTDTNGDYSVDLDDLTSGYENGDLIKIVPQETSITGEVENVFFVDAGLGFQDSDFEFWGPPPHAHSFWVGSSDVDAGDGMTSRSYWFGHPIITDTAGLVSFYGDITFKDHTGKNQERKAVYWLKVSGPVSDSVFWEHDYNPSEGNVDITAQPSVPINPPSAPPAEEYYSAQIFCGYYIWDGSQWCGPASMGVRWENLRVIVIDGTPSPTLTEWGLIVFGGLFILSLIFMLRRRRTRLASRA